MRGPIIRQEAMTEDETDIVKAREIVHNTRPHLRQQALISHVIRNVDLEATVAAAMHKLMKPHRTIPKSDRESSRSLVKLLLPLVSCPASDASTSFSATEDLAISGDECGIEASRREGTERMRLSNMKGCKHEVAVRTQHMDQ